MTRSVRPRMLYHYTGTDGLLGIVRDQVIHATDLRFVNDRTEYQHAIDVAKRLLSGEPASEDRLLFEVISSLLGDPSQYRMGSVYIASFSKAGDDLNQWRAYSSGGTGFCIGFDPRALCASAGPEWQLSQCVYDDTLKDKYITDVLSRTLEQRHLRQWPIDELYIAEKLADWFVEELASVAPRLKDPAFKSEREWRLWRPHAAQHLNWRVGKYVPVPFVKIPLTQSKRPPIRSVRIGPTADPQLARLGLGGLLEDVYGSSHRVTVAVSDVPYRS